MQGMPLQCRNILEATKALPIIGDGDTGFGNALSVKRTVQGFANAGFAGILIEDQVALPPPMPLMHSDKHTSRQIVHSLRGFDSIPINHKLPQAMR